MVRQRFFSRGTHVGYNAGGIRVVSMTRGSSNHDCSYCFRFERTESGGLFSAECTAEEGRRISVENCCIENEDAEKLLRVIDEQALIGSALRHRKSKRKFFAEDEADYGFTLRFSDGSAANSTAPANAELESLFYAFAVKYDRGAN